jgi:hypothetical protein
MPGITPIPRSRGVLSGLLLILLGAWGGLIPFIGPYFHYAYTPDRAWVYTTGRLWLEIVPGVATALGGLLVLASARRPLAMFGAFVAALGGAWFVVGNLVRSLWSSSVPGAGVPVGSSVSKLALEELGFFVGLGVVIVFFAALALGRCAVVGVKDAALAERASEAAAADSYETATAPGSTSPFAGLSAAAAASSSGQGDSFPHQGESYQPAGGPYPGAQHESPTVTGRFPAGERNIFTSAERERYSPESASFPPTTSQFPPGSSGGTGS